MRLGLLLIRRPNIGAVPLNRKRKHNHDWTN